MATDQRSNRSNDVAFHPYHLSRRQYLHQLAHLALFAAPWGAVLGQRVAPLPRIHAVPGGVVQLPLDHAWQDPSVTTLQGIPVLVHATGQGLCAIVGIPLSAPAGSQQLHVHHAAGDSRLSWSIQPHTYAHQRLKVAPQHVDLSPADQARHARELGHQQTIIQQFSPQPVPTSLAMQAPCFGRRSSSFGLRRTFNQQVRAPHSGMDIAAPQGAPVRAPLAGRVLDIGDYFFNGLTVWLDHGQGLLSMYCHLSSVRCEIKQMLDTDTTFAHVGASGRATGAHLHWGVMLNQTMVNPALFLT